MIILGIESSCDETSAALLSVSAQKAEILTQALSSSMKDHIQYGGIVPEVAARKQIEYIVPAIHEALKDMAPDAVDAIAVTVGPGLASSLHVGIDAAKTLSYVWQKPLIPVNHLEGHLLSPLLPESGSGNLPDIFPAVALIVSGGHTELIKVNKPLDYELLGRTRDDAAGEAFDKVARLLDLGYPGGPAISSYAEKGDVGAYDFPRGMIHSKDFDFSFSGLKTSVLYTLKSISLENITDQLKSDVSASFQQSVIDVLVHKTILAAQEAGVNNILLGGGVVANKLLREAITNAASEKGITAHVAPLKFTGDNAAMIAIAGYYRFLNNEHIAPDPTLEAWNHLGAHPNLKLI